MELYHYLLDEKKKDKSFTQQGFAEKLGMSPSQLCRIIHFKIPATPKVAMMIEKATHGHVKAWEMICKFMKLQEKRK